MKEISIYTLSDLEEALSSYGNNFLYRGQTKHYTDIDGVLDIPTSFKRLGCVPPLMFKWSHYARALIRALSGEKYSDINKNFADAILQHYGWRSFYIDLTKAKEIACFFASHKYSDKKHIHMCEDYEESPVHLIHRFAHYDMSEEDGHIYVIDTLILERLGIEVHDLGSIPIEEGWKLRTHAQKACLAGTMSKGLPPEAVVAHLTVSSSALQEYQLKNDVHSTEDVFPNRRDDFILDILLDLSWVKIPVETAIPTYTRGLDIPVYELPFEKHLEPKITLYGEFWVFDHRDMLGSEMKNIVCFKIDETAFYAQPKETYVLPNIRLYLKDHSELAIELDGLVNILELRDSYEYEKGIVLKKIENDSFLISGFIVEYYGQNIGGGGVTKGWHYEFQGNEVSRIENQDDCPCGNTLRHEFHLRLLRVLDELMGEKRIQKENDLTYIDSHLLEKQKYIEERDC